YPDVCSIGLEDEKGGYIATRHLLEMGHQKIAFASPSIRPGGVIEKRLQGYRQALAEFGLPFDPKLIFTQEITVEEGKRLGHVLSERTEITGIFASADILAAGVMAGLSEKGVLVPRDKSIVGFDDNFLAQLTVPGLTTIHQDAEQKGILATDMIMRQLQHAPIEQKNVILPVRLVERGSVRRLGQ
ncbi:MAG: substrate-binding domain-containing protein, partial [Clostridia bacterium]|nr:substrate-binding domain-containing protein [Clostridia bacterium]